MKFKNKFQEGGPMPADPAVQAGDCNIALQVCQMLLELAGGGAAPAPEAAEAPAPAEGEPVYRAGGRLVRRINR